MDKNRVQRDLRKGKTGFEGTTSTTAGTAPHTRREWTKAEERRRGSAEFEQRRAQPTTYPDESHETESSEQNPEKQPLRTEDPGQTT